MPPSSFPDPVIASRLSRAAGARPRRRLLVIAAACVAALAVAALAATLLVRPKDDPAPARFRAAGGAFSVVVPDGWRALRGRALRAGPSAPPGALRPARRPVAARGRPAPRRRPRRRRRPRAAGARAQQPLADARPHRPARPPLQRPAAPHCP